MAFNEILAGNGETTAQSAKRKSKKSSSSVRDQVTAAAKAAAAAFILSRSKGIPWADCAAHQADFQPGKFTLVAAGGISFLPA